jgi:hypothetical protein
MEMAVPLLPIPRLSAEVKRTLCDLADERMIHPASEAGHELALLGATVLPQRQTIARTEHGNWLLVDHVDDPTADEYGGALPVPAEELGRLQTLDEAGVRPQLAWLGHQLPADYVDGDPIPRLVPPPRELREKDERLTIALTRARSLLLTGLGGMLAATAALPLAPLALIGSDPVIFGGVRHPQLPIVAWSVLCSWTWE